MTEPTISGQMPNASLLTDHTLPVMNFPRPYCVTMGHAFQPTKKKISATARTKTNAHMKKSARSSHSFT